MPPPAPANSQPRLNHHRQRRRRLYPYRGAHRGAHASRGLQKHRATNFSVVMTATVGGSGDGSDGSSNDDRGDDGHRCQHVNAAASSWLSRKSEIVCRRCNCAAPTLFRDSKHSSRLRVDLTSSYRYAHIIHLLSMFDCKNGQYVPPQYFHTLATSHRRWVSIPGQLIEGNVSFSFQATHFGAVCPSGCLSEQAWRAHSMGGCMITTWERSRERG